VRVLDLFSGIGGFSLGLERAGMKTVAFCEIDPFCRTILEKHWPNVPIYEDVRTITAERLKRDGIAADVICGGFPCQDVSNAGTRSGLAGERSGLWSEYARLIGDMGPRFVIVENVAALLARGVDIVLRDLAALGYDAEWHCIPAAAVGAQHIRDRIWIIAYSDANRELQSQRREQDQRGWSGDCVETAYANIDQARLSRGVQTGTNGSNDGSVIPRLRLALGTSERISRDYWDHKPVLGRGLHGVPNRVDRVMALGNAVVPQIPEAIGRAIMAATN